ncbi:5,10-methylenetetrahydrofolate reductase [Flexistipes sinusarabici DSM 4947]|uniref:Methylenetetrahydrofolate reductase n=1 Tax=Flexistipes sinusarabici (strain ATCC 49648 / DSM 4947 / MAS 10) TaxID=717231 RepID=F8E883_FLESM|nr:methylenetetrahydrofolate reductase [NAD(P)H] [Flexistipes sinusarabici]AEI15080.1 5,10-methylenetetrahydrofolate reductase [Flexistipes sinusarabici DSM 4947]
MKISDILSRKERVLSFEFFPPKKVENEHILFESIERLKRWNPDFVSVTYGAGGSTRDKTLDWTKKIKDDYLLNVMMHLTCIASTREGVINILKELKKSGIDNIFALRGDIPEELDNIEEAFKDFRYASDLVRLIREVDDSFSIGVAGYPEGHIECPNIGEDIENLKKKVDQGADFIITQLFFDNRYFYDYLDMLEKYCITLPVIAGIMPIINIKQVIKFTDMCGATVPEYLKNKMMDRSPEEMLNIGVDFATKQCRDLLENNVKGLHFYTLNRSRATINVLKNLNLD